MFLVSAEVSFADCPDLSVSVLFLQRGADLSALNLRQSRFDMNIYVSSWRHHGSEVLTEVSHVFLFSCCQLL